MVVGKTNEREIRVNKSGEKAGKEAHDVEAFEHVIVLADRVVLLYLFFTVHVLAWDLVHQNVVCVIVIVVIVYFCHAPVQMLPPLLHHQIVILRCLKLNRSD